MKIKRTRFASYCLGGIAEGCKYCTKGRKIVLFISGLCSRTCVYCSLSSKRRNKDIVWANERECRNVSDMIEEVRASKAKGAGITGGDPLCVLNRTIRYAKALKNKFGKKFHIHIYLPTKLVNKHNLMRLSRYVDEVRFHPEFLTDNINVIRREIEKVKLAKELWPKERIGIELPLLPDKFIETLRIIRACSPYLGFVNLNEFEISDTNFDYVTKHYTLNKDTYTVKGSIDTGLRLMNELKNSGLKIHLCTARTKNFYQYKNRLRLRKILPFGFKTSEGTVRYFAIYSKNLDRLANELRKFKQIYIDRKNGRIILSEKIIKKLGGYKIARVEELPTWDSTILSLEYI